jgi:hypothetical protein
VSHVAEAARLHALGFHPIVERPNSKLPVDSGWQGQVGRSRIEVERAFLAASTGHGIGTVTGEGFIVIDLDVKPDARGIDSLNALPWLPPTLTSCTPSGGQHRFFRIPAGVVIKNSVAKVGPAIDVRGQGGQVVLPPTVLDGISYVWAQGCPDVMADLPAPWLELLAQPAAQPDFLDSMVSQHNAAALEKARPAGLVTIELPQNVAFESERRARYMATLNEPSIQGAGGNAVMMAAAFHAKEMSRGEDEAYEALNEWSQRLATPPWTEYELRRAIQNSEAQLGAGLDRQHDVQTFPALPAFTPEAAQPAADEPEEAEAPVRPGPNPATAPLAYVQAMQAYVARDRRNGTWQLANPMNDKAAVGTLVAAGMTANAARSALKNWAIPIAARVDCDPAQPASFRDEHGDLVLNNYKPSRVVPAPATFPVLDEVLGFLTAGDPEGKAWLLNWLAFAAQNPARMLRTVPVFYGSQRTGKSLIARAMTEMMGEENCATVRNEDVSGRFTSHFVTKLFLTVGEIEAGEVAHATSTLKYLTGEPRLMHEAKGAAAFPVTNRIKMMATSNQTLPVTLEGEADTRWVLFKQMEKPAAEYTARMNSLFNLTTNEWSQAGREELAGFAWHLATLTVDPALAMKVYSNLARTAAVEASRGSVEQFVDAVKASSLDAVWLANVAEHERGLPAYNHLDIPGRPEMAGVSAVYATYRAFCKTSGLQALGTGRFPQEMERHAPSWERTKVAGGVLATRPWVYVGLEREARLRGDHVPWDARRQLPLAEAVAREPDLQQAFDILTSEEDAA